MHRDRVRTVRTDPGGSRGGRTDLGSARQTCRTWTTSRPLRPNPNPLPTGSIERCVDDHESLSWLRAVRPALSALSRSAGDADVRHRARTALALQDVFDTFAVTPIAAWRNYQEFLARADQNPAEIARLIGAAGDEEPPAYLRTAAGTRVVDALLTEVPARLNAALDRLLRPTGSDAEMRAVEDLLVRETGQVDGCGEGNWIVTHVPFLALQEDVAQIWRGDHAALLSDVSPYPLALAAIEIMRPRYSRVLRAVRRCVGRGIDRATSRGRAGVLRGGRRSGR